MTYPQNNAPESDPLMEAAKKPSVSFKNTPLNKVRRFEVKGYSRSAQQTVFGSPGELAFWPPNNDGVRNPKMAVVFDVLDDETNEDRTLWAPKPSSMLSALIEAQTAAGQRIGPGGVLEVYQYGTKPSGKGEDQKLFKAKYTPPAPGSQTPDALSEPATPPSGGFGGGQSAPSDPWSTPVGGGDEPPF